MSDDLREAERLAELESERDARAELKYARKVGKRILANEERAAFDAELARATFLGPTWNAFLDDFAALRMIP